VAEERTAADIARSYADIETEQARHAREAAEAIFNPKPPSAGVERERSEGDHAAGTTQLPVRVPRILAVSAPPPGPAGEPEPAAKPTPLPRKQHGAEIPQTEYSRIRTLASHGMTVSQVAELYAVAESEIHRIIGKVTRAHRSRSPT
jgi:hypothetical protein